MYNKSPVFIVGSERSGSTMFRLMLSHHSKVCVCPEFEFSVDPEYYDGLSDSKESLRRLSSNWIFKSLEVDLDYEKTYRDNMKNILNEFRNKYNKEVVTAIVHKNFDKLLEIWPGAKFIHLLRDPRDVAKSVVQMGWSSHVLTGVDRWLHAEECWGVVDKSIPNQNKIEVRFEELVKNPSKELHKVCDFLEVDMDNAMLNYYKSSSYNKPDKKICQSWLQKLTEREVSLLEYKLQPWLKKYKYEQSGLDVKKVSWLVDFILPLKDWIHRFKHRVNLYGLKNVGLDWLHRNFTLPKKMHARLDNQMHSQWVESLR